MRKDYKEILDSVTVSLDFLDLFLGKNIGSGCARDVYLCRIDPSLVIKIEMGFESFQNILEWNFWTDVEHNKEISKWLAPCEWISGAGTILIQKRVEPIRESELPKEIPAFLTDLKKDNFGILNKKFVSFDYALNVTSCSVKMKKANWHI